MALRPVHVLLLVLPICAYLFFRAAEMEAEVHGLERRIEALDHPAVVGGSAPQGRSPGFAAAADEAPELEALRQQVIALRTQVDDIAEKQAALGTPDAILGVVEEEKRRVQSVLVDFHAERWQEAADEALEVFAQQAGLTDSQRQAVGAAMTSEVNRLAEIGREPAALEDPDKLSNDVMQLLDDTNSRVSSLLNPNQRAVWERLRAHDRKATYPWLPR